MHCTCVVDAALMSPMLVCMLVLSVSTRFAQFCSVVFGPPMPEDDPYGVLPDLHQIRFLGSCARGLAIALNVEPSCMVISRNLLTVRTLFWINQQRLEV